MRTIKTPSDLKAAVEEANPASRFFDRKTMQFFGDTMSNFGVRRTTITTDYNREGKYDQCGHERIAWELYRRRPVKYGASQSFYFDAETFRRIIPREK